MRYVELLYLVITIAPRRAFSLLRPSNSSVGCLSQAISSMRYVELLYLVITIAPRRAFSTLGLKLGPPLVLLWISSIWSRTVSVRKTLQLSSQHNKICSSCCLMEVTYPGQISNLC